VPEPVNPTPVLAGTEHVYVAVFTVTGLLLRFVAQIIVLPVKTVTGGIGLTATGRVDVLTVPGPPTGRASTIDSVTLTAVLVTFGHVVGSQRTRTELVP
jgi:hypothetical protein